MMQNAILLLPALAAICYGAALPQIIVSETTLPAIPTSIAFTITIPCETSTKGCSPRTVTLYGRDEEDAVPTWSIPDFSFPTRSVNFGDGTTQTATILLREPQTESLTLIGASRTVLESPTAEPTTWTTSAARPPPLGTPWRPWFRPTTESVSDIVTTVTLPPITLDKRQSIITASRTVNVSPTPAPSTSTPPPWWPWWPWPVPTTKIVAITGPTYTTNTYTVTSEIVTITSDIITTATLPVLTVPLDKRQTIITATRTVNVSPTPTPSTSTPPPWWPWWPWLIPATITSSELTITTDISLTTTVPVLTLTERSPQEIETITRVVFEYPEPLTTTIIDTLYTTTITTTVYKTSTLSCGSTVTTPTASYTPSSSTTAWSTETTDIFTSTTVSVLTVPSNTAESTGTPLTTLTVPVERDVTPSLLPITRTVLESPTLIPPPSPPPPSHTPSSSKNSKRGFPISATSVLTISSSSTTPVSRLSYTTSTPSSCSSQPLSLVTKSVTVTTTAVSTTTTVVSKTEIDSVTVTKTETDLSTITEIVTYTPPPVTNVWTTTVTLPGLTLTIGE